MSRGRGRSQPGFKGWDSVRCDEMGSLAQNHGPKSLDESWMPQAQSLKQACSYPQTLKLRRSIGPRTLRNAQNLDETKGSVGNAIGILERNWEIIRSRTDCEFLLWRWQWWSSDKSLASIWWYLIFPYEINCLDRWAVVVTSMTVDLGTSRQITTVPLAGTGWVGIS